jgi:hypothetical protein
MQPLRPGKRCRLVAGPSGRAVVIVILANVLFLALRYAAPGDPDVVAHRVRTAFATGDLGLPDYRPLDTRRGWHQYNDCNVLQMLSNRDSSRTKRALGPIIYRTDQEFRHACPALYALVVQRADPDTLPSFRYARYWHGYNVTAGLALRIMELRDLRRALSIAVWLAITLLALATYRRGPHTQRTGLAIALAAAVVWAVPYFAPGLTHGPGDAIVLLALAGIAVRPRMAGELRAIVPYAAGFGAVVVFFEMLTGQLPIAAVWLMAMTLAASRDEERPGEVRPPVAASAAVIAFVLGAAATVVVKQILGFILATPDAGTLFMIQLRDYTSVPRSEGRWPGIVVPYVELVRKSSMLTYGNRLAGRALIAAMTLTWLVALARAWRWRHAPDRQDVLVLFAAALIPGAWVLLLPRHTYLHAPFMVRMLVAPISLAPLALVWPRSSRRPPHTS